MLICMLSQKVEIQRWLNDKQGKLVNVGHVNFSLVTIKSDLVKEIYDNIHASTDGKRVSLL